MRIALADGTIPELAGPRVLLRAPGERDAGAWTRFYADADASRFYGGPLPPTDAWKRLAQHLGHWALRGYGLWTVADRATGEALGGSGLLWPGGWPRPELTWWLLPEARGRGLAEEASRLVVAHAVGVAGWPFVQTHMLDENEPARRLALRLGGVPIAREAFPDGRERTVYRLDPDGTAAGAAAGVRP